MSNPIRIRRRAASSGAGAPSSLLNAELAYNEASDILYYGTGTGGAGGSATQVIPIAGKGAYVDVNTDQTIAGAKTFTSTVSANISGSAGSVVASLTIGSGLTNVGGSTFNGSSERTVALPTFGTAGSYGSSTAIPQITVDDYGRITSASTTSISTTVNLSGNTGTGSVAGGGTLSISGANGFTTTVSGSTVTVQPSSTTGSGNLVFSNSPSLTTPNLGAATATSITASASNITISAASGNNNVYLVPTGTGIVDVGGKRIGNLIDPVFATDAVTKEYVDNLLNGLDWKSSVNLLANSNISLSGNTGTLIIDGHDALVTADSGYRILLINQSTSSENGIYVYNDNGTTYTLTRSADADTYQELINASVLVTEGTTYQNTGWTQTNHYLTSFSGQTWNQFNSGGTSYTAGGGIAITGNTISVDVDNTTISINNNKIQIKSTYVGQSSITTLGTITTGTWNANIINPTYGGTGVNNGSNTITLAGNFVTSGANSLTLTTTGTTNVTLPTSGTLLSDSSTIDGGTF